MVSIFNVSERLRVEFGIIDNILNVIRIGSSDENISAWEKVNEQHSTHRLNLPRRCKSSNRVVHPSDISSGHVFITDPHSERSIRIIYRWSKPEFQRVIIR